MLVKKERTLEVYMKAGAEMRLFKTLGGKLAVDISDVLSASDRDMLMRALAKINEVCSRAEDNMYSDHPELSKQYVDVFYGSIDGEPRNDVDKEIIEMAKETADGLFKEEDD